MGNPRGKAWCESVVGKCRGKASRESHRSLDPLEGKLNPAATAREESARAFPHSGRGLTPLGRLQMYPKIHVSTGEESSGSRLITPNLWNFQRVLHTLAPTQKFREIPSPLEREHESPAYIQRSPFPPPSPTGGILSLRVRKRIPGVPVTSQEGALSTGKARGNPGSCHHS